MVHLPPAARLTIWGNAVFRGTTSLDDAAERIAADGPAHRVAGLPHEREPAAMTVALGRLRSLGVTRLRLVLPAAGDVSGLGGPPTFNQLAVEAGATVLTAGAVSLGLVPGARSTWQAHPAHPGPPLALSLRDGQRLFHEELLACVEHVHRLDVPSWHPEAAGLLAQHDEVSGRRLPPGYPAEAVNLLASATRVQEIVRLGMTTDAAAMTASSIAARTAAFARLSVAVRRALEAACNVPP